MAKKTVPELMAFAGNLFQNQFFMKTLWQTIADHFYCERADFTVTRNIGQELADNLIDSYPLLIRRDLGNALSSMLRDGMWFRIGLQDNEPDHLGQMYLDFARTKLYRHMYQKGTGFTRAMSQGDHDYITFGQCVIGIKPNYRKGQLLFQSWHLRDCAWTEDESGEVDAFVREWCPTRHDMIRTFGAENVHGNVIQGFTKDPFKTVKCYHMVLPVELRGDDQQVDNAENFPFVSIWLDTENQQIIEEQPIRESEYVVPRFQTVAGSPYAYSPATVIALPDARLLQGMTHTLLEAAERYARPPIVATAQVVQGNVDFGPDGITWVDSKYDERLGASLRTIPQDRGGFPVGQDMRDSVVSVLDSAFYLSKLSLPEVSREMTAYEVSERMKQFRREALPLFTPIESEYNARVCERAFNVAMGMGFLGEVGQIPESVRGRDVRFKFESPLSDDEEREKASKFQQTAQMLREAAEIDPGVVHNANMDIAFRDAVAGIGAPTKVLRPMEEVIARRQQDAQQAQMQQAMPLLEKAVAAG